MGKHNGKSRNKGLVVGSALLKRKMGGGKTNQGRKAEDAGSRHTTDMGGPNNTQSIVEMNDLDELMNMVSFFRVFIKTKRERREYEASTSPPPPLNDSQVGDNSPAKTIEMFLFLCH